MLCSIFSLQRYGCGSKGVYPLADWSLRNAWRGNGSSSSNEMVQVVLSVLPPLAGERALLSEAQHGNYSRDMVGWQKRVGMHVMLRDKVGRIQYCTLKNIE